MAEPLAPMPPTPIPVTPVPPTPKPLLFALGGLLVPVLSPIDPIR